MKQTIKRIFLRYSHTGPYGSPGLLCVLFTMKGLVFPTAILSPTKIVLFSVFFKPHFCERLYDVTTCFCLGWQYRRLFWVKPLTAETLSGVVSPTSNFLFPIQTSLSAHSVFSSIPSIPRLASALGSVITLLNSM